MGSTFYTGLILGIAGSIHCVGMCGPLVLSIPLRSNQSLASFWMDKIIYHLGRITVYAAFGALAGWLGSNFPLFQWQQRLSFGMGLLMILAALSFFKKIPLPSISGGMIKVVMVLKSKISGIHGLHSIFLGGMINGLLPCGLVYTALSGSVITGNRWEGALFMASFGLGIVPSLLTVNYFGLKMGNLLQVKMKKVVPFFIGFMGILLITRGMGLGIPYISPKLVVTETDSKMECCHK